MDGSEEEMETFPLFDGHRQQAALQSRQAVRLHEKTPPGRAEFTDIGTVSVRLMKYL